MSFHHLRDMPSWEWPENAPDLLLTGLLDPRTSDVDLQLATSLASELLVMDDRLADALLHLVQSPGRSDDARGAAAIALGPVLEDADTAGFDDPEAVAISLAKFREIQAELNALYSDPGVPPAVRRRVLEASVRAPESWHRKAVRDAYASADRSERITAVFCMGYLQGFEEQILEALESGDPDVVLEAVRAAGAWDIRAAWPRVSELLTKPGVDKHLLLAAIESTATIRPEEVHLLDRLRSHPDPEIAEAVEDAQSAAIADEPDAEPEMDPKRLN